MVVSFPLPRCPLQSWFPRTRCRQTTLRRCQLWQSSRGRLTSRRQLSSFTAWSDSTSYGEQSSPVSLGQPTAQLVTCRCLTCVMAQKAPKSVSRRFTPKSCKAREGVCLVGVSCRRLRHGPMMFSRWVTFARRVSIGSCARRRDSGLRSTWRLTCLAGDSVKS